MLTPFATYSAAAPHVGSKLLFNSAQGLVSGASATPPSALPPVPAAAFKRPTAQYRVYAVQQLGLMEEQLAPLERALAANDRASAQEAWRAAYTDYLRLGAVYLDGQTALDGQVASLNQAIDGNPGGLAGGAASPQFTGLHRIEDGLWTDTAPRTLVGFARRSRPTCTGWHTCCPGPRSRHSNTRPAHTRSSRTRRASSSAERTCRWSGEGVLATDAGLDATEEVIATLRPLLKGRENTIPTVDAELASLRSTMASLAAAHGGRLPSNGQLTQRQSELLDGTLGGALEALSQVPGALETELPPQIPQVPQREERIEP